MRSGCPRSRASCARRHGTPTRRTSGCTCCRAWARCRCRAWCSHLRLFYADLEASGAVRGGPQPQDGAQRAPHDAEGAQPRGRRPATPLQPCGAGTPHRTKPLSGHQLERGAARHLPHVGAGRPALRAVAPGCGHWDASGRAARPELARRGSGAAAAVGRARPDRRRAARPTSMCRRRRGAAGRSRSTR